MGLRTFDKAQERLGKREATICDRLVLARATAGFTQEMLALSIGVKRERIASHENWRSPVSFEVGILTCQVLDVSAAWMSGIGDSMFPYEGYPRKLIAKLPMRQRFSKIYDETLSAMPIGPTIPFSQSSTHYHAGMEQVIAGEVIRVGHRVDPNEFQSFAQFIFTMILHFVSHPQRAMIGCEMISASLDAKAKIELADMVGRFVVGRISLENSQAARLTDISEYRKDTPVPLTLPELIKRLRQCTANRGRKQALAAELAVAPARISEWISGKNEPGGGVTLRLLHWVLAEEAKQQEEGPGAVDAAPRPKTHKKQTYAGKPKAGPKET